MPAWLRDAPARRSRRRLHLRRRTSSRVEQLRELTDAIRAANPDAVIAIDEEGGDVTRLYYDQRFAVSRATPCSAASTTSSSPPRSPRAVGGRCVAVGCNLNFAPDVDINSNPDNPVIGVRSFGAEPELGRTAHRSVGRRHCRQTGVAASAKHFPGHGDTATDSHLALPVVDLPLDDTARSASSCRSAPRSRRARARS